jgi:hypothetical protein
MVSFNKLSQYGLPFQLKVINQLLTNKEFLLNIRDTIQEEYFVIQTDTVNIEFENLFFLLLKGCNCCAAIQTRRLK